VHVQELLRPCVCWHAAVEYTDFQHIPCNSLTLSVTHLNTLTLTLITHPCV